jgi:Zn-dependent metalloprotease
MASDSSRFWCSFVPTSFLHSLADNELEDTEIREAARATAKRDISWLEPECKKADDELHTAPVFHEFNEDGMNLYLYDARGSLLQGGLMKISQTPELDATLMLIRERLRRIHDFFKDVFNHDLYTMDKNMEITFHYGRDYINAHWTGYHIILGSGKSPHVKDFSLVEDVLAHEITHAVIMETGHLENAHETGALVEHLADVFAVMHKQRLQAGILGIEIEQYPWTIGEGLWCAVADECKEPFAIASAAKTADSAVNHPRYFRSMKNPQATRQPIHWTEYRRLHHDRGGVHHNSGIPNHAFYIAATKSGLPPWEGVGKIWFKAMRNRNLGNDCTFARFAAFTLAYAEHKGSPSVREAIASGWQSVGVDPDHLPNAALVLTSFVSDHPLVMNDEAKAKVLGLLGSTTFPEFDHMTSSTSRFRKR